MAKYDPLRDYLQTQQLQEFELSFSKIEQILGVALPKSSLRPQFWANVKSKPSSFRQREAWRDAGYDAFLQKDLDKVRFVKAT